jgi:hypothetical protein
MCQAASSTFGLRAIAHPLLTSLWVCAMRRAHPLTGKKLTLERYAQAKRLLVTVTGESIGLIDPLLQKRGLTRSGIEAIAEQSTTLFVLSESEQSAPREVTAESVERVQRRTAA